MWTRIDNDRRRRQLDREIQARRTDRDFQLRVEQMMRDNAQVLKRLAR